MLTNTIKTLLNYFQEGFYSRDNQEEALKTYLIYAFSFIGFIFLFALGLKGLESSPVTLTSFLLGGSLLILFNFVYLKQTGKYIVSGYIVFYFFFALMFYLVYSGGVDNTGPLWIFSLPPIALYIHGFKRGLLHLAIFLFSILVILYLPDHGLLNAQYSDAFKLRIVLSFILATILSAIYGYSREKSSNKMKKLSDDLEFFLRRDELTGLYNRRGFQDNIHKIKETHGAIIMCDIDHFKKINDTYGHDAGDFTIKEVSHCIKNNLRKGDIAVRWGGEEFFIFLPEINIHDAYMVSQKLRVMLENHALKYNNDMIFHVTISLGVAMVNDDITLEAAIKNADSAMYHSKKSGRNKSTVF